MVWGEFTEQLTTDYTVSSARKTKKPGALLLRVVLFETKLSAYSDELTVTLLTLAVPDVVLLCDVIGTPT